MTVSLKYNKKNKTFDFFVHLKLVYSFNFTQSKNIYLSTKVHHYLYVNKILRSLGLVSALKNKKDFYN